MNKKIVFCIIAMLMGTNSLYAKSDIEAIGDVTQAIIPAYALGMTINEPGWTGTKEFVAQFAAMEIVVNGLKHFVPEERPDHSDKKSFPSGHSASAFSGAAFIHKRYGIKRAIIPYLAAGFTGFSRVYAKRHHVHDVLAGAAIGGLTGYFFTSRQTGTSTQIELSPERVALRFNATF